MVNRYTRLRVRRKIRSRKKQVVGISENANKQLDRHIFRRWHNLKTSWRFVAGWLGLLVLLVVAVAFQTRALGSFYLKATPTEGGVYSEGMVGTFSNANPIYAVSGVDAAVSRLVFSPLLTYDNNNQLTGDLASSWDVDAKAMVYTVKLKPNLTWHDGKPLTADDVVFTYKSIQNPDVKSPLLASWRGVKIEKVDNATVRFTLPTAYSPFLHSLTTGILPAHILKNVAPEQLRSTAFNTKSPIGSGPFKWRGVTIQKDSKTQQTEIIQLSAFNKYSRGAPKLDGVTIHTFQTDDDLQKAVKNKQIITASGLTLQDKEIDVGYYTTSFNLMSADMLFLKNTSPNLSDVKVRQALTKGTNVSALTAEVGYSVIPVRQPILRGQVGYNPAYAQAGFDKAEAAKLLDEAGWKLAPGETVRKKDGVPLKLNLSYETNADFSRIAGALQKQWADIGVELSVDVKQDDKSSLKLVDSHDYDVLLYGINIGPDPDVYAYWHSSQFDKKSPIHLNLSEYSSKQADLALEGGRTRVDAKLRAAKYKPFLEAWQKDAPAIGLYQPRYLYVSNQKIYGLDEKTINAPSDRFNDVYLWMINTERAEKS